MKLNLIETDNMILFTPTALFNYFLFHKKMNVPRRSFMGKLYSEIMRYYFFPLHFVIIDYFKYYYEEFESYNDFLKNHFNLLENEYLAISTIFLMYSKKTRSARYHSFTNVKSLTEKINKYFGGNFYYED